ncbi:MAG: nucleotidyltransferase family protein, partial [Evtepia sp.]
MRTIGVIAEYNPFHSGHRHQLTELRRVFGPDCALVCAMSGNWVQRGEPALTDKWSRAAMALAGGADLVLELPTLWAASSAETFAQGGVALLEQTGVVDTLCFGSEAGTLPPLQATAQCLQSDAWREGLRRYLDLGLSFPAARQKAAEDLIGPAAQCLREPNNNLGIEYLRAMETLGSSMTPCTIPRKGAAHDDVEAGDGPHVSASYLRARILQEDPEPLTPYLREEDEVDLRLNPASLTFCTRGVLAKLRSMEEADFAQLPDSGEGLANKLQAAARQASSLEELYALAKSKRYTHARIRRMVLWAFLGLQESQRPKALPYLRVLGFSPRGQRMLREMKSAARLPVVVKPAHAAKLDEEARRVFQLEARCTALYD